MISATKPISNPTIECSNQIWHTELQKLGSTHFCYYNSNQLNALLYNLILQHFSMFWAMSRKSVVEYKHYGTMLYPSTYGTMMNHQCVLQDGVGTLEL